MLLHLTSNYDFMWKRIVFGIMWLKIVVFLAGILSMWSTTFFQNFNFEFDWMTTITFSYLKVIKNMFIPRRVTYQFYGYMSPNYRNLLVRWTIFYQYNILLAAKLTLNTFSYWVKKYCTSLLVIINMYDGAMYVGLCLCVN